MRRTIESRPIACPLCGDSKEPAALHDVLGCTRPRHPPHIAGDGPATGGGNSGPEALSPALTAMCRAILTMQWRKS